MKRILLLGGSGFIGMNLQKSLLESGSCTSIYCLGRKSAASREFNIPLRDDQKIQEIIIEKRIDTVIHLASDLLPSGGLNELEKEFEEVIKPTFRLVEFCARNSVDFVLFSSGGTVYGDGGSSRISEGHPLAPKSYYGYAKVLLEEYVGLCHRSMGLRYIIVRPSNPYGRHQNTQGRQGFIAVALGRVISGAPVEIWGDGEIVRDYLDIRDLSSAVVELIRGEHFNQTFNIGSGVGHSLNDVIGIIQQVTGRPAAVLKFPERNFDVKSIVLDTKLLSSVINWQPRALIDGIREFTQILDGK